jgi:hypothetical protein
VCLIVLFLAGVCTVTPARAAPSPPEDVLLALPMPAANALEVPAGLSPQQAEMYASGITYRMAAPLLGELERLQKTGHLLSFEIRPDLHAIEVTGVEAGTLTDLQRSPHVGASFPAAGPLPVCASGAPQALITQVWAMSHVRPTSVNATDPSISVYRYPPNDYTSVYGSTAPTTTVTMRLLRGGTEIVSRTTTSSTSGHYSFYPSWQSCPDGSYDWIAQVGDVVEVTANGNTVTTVVAPLTAWADPATDTVSGETSPDRSVEPYVYNYSTDPCDTTTYSLTVAAEADGSFAADFSSLVDFDHSASATVYAYDANGNDTHISINAYSIRAEFSRSYLSGYLKPEVTYTASLSRSGAIISTFSDASNALGYYSGNFTNTLQAGDVVQVSGSGMAAMQYTVVDHAVMPDVTGNRVLGKTAADHPVQVWGHKRSGDAYHLRTSCLWMSDCGAAVADSTGAFTVPLDIDVVRGDYYYLTVYDSAGNYQTSPRYAFPALAADLSSQVVRGYWIWPRSSLILILRDEMGSVKTTQSSIYVSSWNASFSAWIWGMVPGDTIEVGDGVYSQTMEVQDVTAHLDSATGHLTGTAPNGPWLGTYYDFQRDTGYWMQTCVTTSVSGGTFDLVLGDDIGAQDYVYIESTGPDGHYTRRTPHAFTVNTYKGGNYLYGYTARPSERLTVTLEQEGTAVFTDTRTAYSDGWFSLNMYNYTGSVTITTGNVLRVATGGGDQVSLTIPELTANADPATNSVYGQAPAETPVIASVRRYYPWGYYLTRQATTSDANGEYSASFDGEYWWRDCSAVDLEHRCTQPAVDYYTADSHRITTIGPFDNSIAPDAYEPDDSHLAATTYEGVQSHTFHTVTDTDWISFTVSAADVTAGTEYHLRTFNLGWGMGTRVRVYYFESIGVPIAEWTGYEYQDGIDVSWTPIKAGRYYVEVSPPNGSYTSYCDAVYDVAIDIVRGEIFLPMLVRDE